jgi:large subunit ribosomal protein L2
MNPCDHPHGGGEGKTSGKKAARTPWGKLTKAVPTKRTKKEVLRKKLNKQ